MSGRYLTFDQYDGTLSGRSPLPSGPYDVSSPGGLASIQHHHTRGFLGKGDRTYDVYAGTGDRYISGEYGNLYSPKQHASVWNHYGGPHTAPTEYTTLQGDPYYFNNTPNTPITGGVENFDLKKSLQGPASPPEDFDPNMSITPKVLSPSPKGSHPSKISPPQIKKISSRTSDSSSQKEESEKRGKVCLSIGKSKNLTLIVMIFILAVAAITFDFWTETIHRFVEQYLSRGLEISWTKYAGYATASTVFLFLATYALGAQSEFQETE